MFTSGWTVPLKLSSFLSKYKLSIRSRTSHFHVKWDVKPQMWVTSLRVPRLERWHLIPEPVQPRVIYSGLSTAAIHVITSQGFSVLQVLQLLCHPGLLPDAHRAVMSAVSSDHRPPPHPSSVLLSRSILTFHIPPPPCYFHISKKNSRIAFKISLISPSAICCRSLPTFHAGFRPRLPKWAFCHWNQSVDWNHFTQRFASLPLHHSSPPPLWLSRRCRSDPSHSRGEQTFLMCSLKSELGSFQCHLLVLLL